MGTIITQNRTTFERCPKNEQHPFCRIPVELLKLNGYQLAIMVQILSNKDDWNLVKSEIGKRVGFPREKFRTAWESLKELGYIKVNRIQGGYDYTICEDISSTSTTYGICESFTSTTGRTCTGGTLTTINNNNYYRDVTNTAGSTCNESQFNELLELYPSVGTKPDGTIYQLKSKRNDCEKAYVEYLKTGVMTHDEIMTALQVELNDRQMTGKTHFQKGLLRWINDRIFELHRGKIIEPIELGYGLNLE
jgi:hypothetical protein